MQSQGAQGSTENHGQAVALNTTAQTRAHRLVIQGCVLTAQVSTFTGCQSTGNSGCLPANQMEPARAEPHREGQPRRLTKVLFMETETRNNPSPQTQKTGSSSDDITRRSYETLRNMFLKDTTRYRETHMEKNKAVKAHVHTCAFMSIRM